MRSSSRAVIGVTVPAPSARLRNGSSILRAVRQVTPSIRFVASPARCFNRDGPVRYAPTLTDSARCMCAASSRRRIRETLAMRLPRALEPLAHRDFRLLWTGQTVSLLGNFVHGVALPFQILALGGGALELGLWGGIFSLTTLIFVLLGGAIADRFPRRAVILVSDLLAGLVVATIAALAGLGQLRIEHLYVEAALFGAVESFFQPSLSALITELVPAAILQAGNALRGSSRQIAML